MLFLVRYGEIGLKSPYVVRQLTDRLVGNIGDLFAAAGLECSIRREPGRLFVGSGDSAAARRLLARAFGIVSFSPVVEVAPDLDAIAAAAAALARDLLRPGQSFAIRARRAGELAFTSQDIARRAGRAVQEATGAPVDLDTPGREIHVEARPGAAYLYSEVLPGPGGLPLGSQGRVAALVGDPRGMVAAWLMMRRGCRVLVGGLDGEPWVAPLRAWDVKLRAVPVGGLGELASLARKKRIGAIAVGWTLGEAVARGRPEGITLFHPLAGLPEEEVEALRRRIEEP